jgi:peptidoglycan/LPS O-acetylase OafA/YrhL
MDKPRSFVCLDALRGVAAIAVLLFHTSTYLGKVLFPHGYLAVDFFFMLSGFVLSFAYQEKIDQGGFFWRFIKTRVIRLYPLYLLALLTGVALVVIQAHIYPQWMTPRTIAILSLCGLFFVPTPPSVPFRNFSAFPLNAPSWSLFGEIVANILHASLLKRRSTRFLCVLAALLGALAISLGHHFGTLDFGYSRSEVYLALARVMFAYVLGMLMYRLHLTGKVTIGIPPVASCLILMALLAVWNPPQYELAADLVFVMVLAPVLLVMSARSHPSPRFASVARLLGLSSYALYVLHVPFSAVFDHLWSKLRGPATAHDAPWRGIIYVVFTILLAILADRLYDTPVRAALARRFLRRGPVTEIRAAQSS